MERNFKNKPKINENESTSSSGETDAILGKVLPIDT
jgi:hypothetical protein